MSNLNEQQFGSTVYHHASDVLFEPGDVIHPASAIGAKSVYEGNNKQYSPDHVYLYNKHETDPDFRLQGGAVYEVQPHNPVEPDPEPWRGKGPAKGSYRTPGPATVVRVVQNNWKDPNESVPQSMRGPNWKPSEQPRARRV